MNRSMLSVMRPTWLMPSSSISPPAALLLVEFRNDVRTEQLDRAHHVFMRNVVRVEQAEQELAADGFVPLADLDATIRVADHARAGVVEVVHGQVVEEAGFVALQRLARVGVVAEILAARLHPL